MVRSAVVVLFNSSAICYLFVTEKLLSMQMENFVHFLQHDLEKDFGLDDDAVLLELSVSYNLRDTGWWIS